MPPLSDNFGITLQQAVVEGLGSNEKEQSERLRSLKPALRELRNSYRRGASPDFADALTREAYACAYHPHHASVAATALHAAGADLLDLKGSHAHVVVLGGGPLGELVGLAHFARRHLPNLRELRLTVVDREEGWKRNHPYTAIAPTAALWSGSVDLQQLCVDLSTSSGLSELRELVATADLVTAQTVITEIPNPLGQGSVIDFLTDYLGADTRLLFIDLLEVRGTRPVAASFEREANLRTLVETDDVHLASAPIPIIASNLFDGTDGLRPRKNVKCLYRLYARPGSRITAPPSDSAPTSDQLDAIEAFRTFLSSKDKVCLLTGGAGTGKTSLFPELVRLSHNAGLATVLLAPTGQAARRLSIISRRNASTIHRRIYDFEKTQMSTAVQEDKPTEDESAKMPISLFKRKQTSEIDSVYLIDEASLIGNKSNEHSDSPVKFAEGKVLDDLLKHALETSNSKVVFVGDPHQLPPVGEPTSPALDSASFEGLGVAPEIRLVEVHRQHEGSQILEVATACREERWHSLPSMTEDSDDVQMLARPEAPPRYVLRDAGMGKSVVVCARNVDVAHWNHEVRCASGRKTRQVSPGDLVMVLRNHGSLGLLNGDLLEVTAVSDKLIKKTLRGQGATLRECEFRYDDPAVGYISFSNLLVDDLLFEPSQAKQKEIDQLLVVDFKRRRGLKESDSGFQAELLNDDQANPLRVSYAYARTCHRAQGGEWDRVIVDFNGSDSLGPALPRWGYTATTRARSTLWLTNLPMGRTSIEHMLPSIEAALAPSDILLVHQGEIQDGIQLTVDRQGETARLNVYRGKKGVSNVTPTGVPSTLRDEACALITDLLSKTKESTLSPLPACLADVAIVLTSAMQAKGYDFALERPAQYQVRFSLVDTGRRASITYDHNASGALTGERQNSGSATLLEELRTAVTEATLS